MKKLFIILILQVLLLAQVKTGIEILKENNFAEIKGKKVGLITNPTGVDKDLNSTIDILFQAPNVKLVALFAPEHGVRGDYYAGDNVENTIDPKTNLPVYSLHGKFKKPTKEMLNDIDALIYDIQDIGCRSYTYISTMALCMEACAEYNKEFIVLDRPNPLGGKRVEGNIVEKGFFSFISQLPIPYVYGLTPGELANLINNEGMLQDGKKCKLTVIKMEGWKRNMIFEQTGLPWVLTSPNVPHQFSPFYYVASGIMGELSYFSEGVGYTLPFQLFAAEWIDPILLAEKMNALNLPGVKFRPITIKGMFGRYQGKKLGGVQIYIQDYDKVNLISLQFYFMQVHNELYPDKNPFKDNKRISSFNKAIGTDKIATIFSKNFLYKDIENYLNKDVEPFKKLSKKYYLYN
ncbi:MAG TPA: DUF1343 domain-containing protein [Ignavibacteriales bacterium]|nr:DUF1343 domain-containing protein [Ignavibacteriales bacterium]HOL80343.1 DUF1343 domain-containing protein [Ignavibacteriales bacterium]HOM64622.1 DUF1343 domain-containing protein [Ignavibacteriales bacterium]HPD68190.1 DUF1343 domain-containing protein [Ignavibacteriales bacterium]HPP32532.1 DUF1343 domain-containing protein [Ignavibacteriales bacterium]